MDAVPRPGAADETGQTSQWLGTFTGIDDLKLASGQLEEKLSMNRIAGRVAQLGGWAIELPNYRTTETYADLVGRKLRDS